MNDKVKKVFINVGVLTLIILSVWLLTLLINFVFFRHYEPLVYRTEYGECFHAEGCQYLYNSKIPIGLKQAKNVGLYACSVCNGASKDSILINGYGESLVISIIIFFVIIAILGVLSDRIKRRNKEHV